MEVLSFKTDSLKSIDAILGADEENPESIFSKGIQDINSSMLGPFALNDIIRIAMETIYQGMQTLQVQRALFFVRDIKKPQMEIRIGFGNGITGAKKWFIISIGDSKDIFNMALTKDSDLLIKDTVSSDIRKFIPSWYRANVPAPGYIILFPVTVNKKNIGLICIEGDKQGFPKITKSHLNYLRMLRDQTVIATKQSFRSDIK
jgi:hypothetical protein